MIVAKRIDLVETDGEIRKYDVDLYSDTKSEVTPGAPIKGLPADAQIVEGSTIYTASLDVGVMKSDGNWKWS